MSKNSTGNPTAVQCNFFHLAAPVKISRWLEHVKDWLESGADYSLKLYALLRRSVPKSSFLKMSLDSCPVGALKNPRRAVMRWEWNETENCGKWTRYQTLALSSPNLLNSGIIGPHGDALTFNSLALPSDAKGSSLSDVLETGPVPARYYLSPKACAGILRRAEKRGKKLPEALDAALRAVGGRI